MRPNYFAVSTCVLLVLLAGLCASIGKITYFNTDKFIFNIVALLGLLFIFNLPLVIGDIYGKKRKKDE